MGYDFFKGFTNNYSLSKTLRFELIPMGKTLTNIEKKGLIFRDDDRAINYKKVKKIIDGYHKYFIELALKEVVLSKLNEYSEMYFQSKEVRDEDNFKAIKNLLNALPQKFRRKEAIFIADEKFKIKSRSAETYLSKLVANKWLTQARIGNFEKVKK